MSVCVLLCSVTFASADIISCKRNGKVVFTDDVRKCDSDIASANIQQTKDKRVNFRYPTRNYTRGESAYTVFFESPETEADRVKMRSAVKRLNETLDLIFARIPSASHAYLKKINFYIMIGPRSALGGEDGGLRYFPKSGDQKLMLGDKRWTHSVVVYSVDNFMALSDLWTNKSIMHELAHAWHYEDWAHSYPVLKSTWLSARQQGLYLAQKDIKGKILEPAYASTNEKEYFAELSTMYFVECNYFPFNRQELKQYDAKGYAMIEQIWGI